MRNALLKAESETRKKLTGVFYYRVMRDLDPDLDIGDNEELLKRLGVANFTIDDIYKTIETVYNEEDFKVHGVVDVIEAFNWIEDEGIVAYYKDLPL